MKCLHCGLELQSNAKFCSNCGNRVISCSRCHNLIEKNDKSCRHCGFDNNKDTCPRCNNILAKTEKFCGNCGLENRDLCGEEPPVDDYCSNDIWYPPQTDVTNQSSKEKPTSTRDQSSKENPSKADRNEETDKFDTDGQLENEPSQAPVADINQPLDSEQQLTQHQKQHVSVAIAGETWVGKSTFINLIMDYSREDKNYAEIGHGNATMRVTTYTHPKNENFTITDMPGYGTLQMPMKKFVELANLSDFDYFLIFFNPVLKEVDMQMVQILEEKKVPFALVRTKVDIFLEEKKDDKNGAIDILRKKLQREHKDYTHFDQCKLFLISTLPKYLATCDMSFLIGNIASKLGSAKSVAFLLQIGILTPDIIEMKYNELYNRIKWVAGVTAATAASSVPVADIAINYKILIRELNIYVNTFGLDKDFVPSVPGLKSVFSKSKERSINWKALLGQGFGQIARGTLAFGLSQADVAIPIVGSAISGSSNFLLFRSFLKNHLDDLRDDALTVFNKFTNNS